LISRLFQIAFIGCRDSDFRNSSNHSLASYCATIEEKFFKTTWIASRIFSTDFRLIIAMLLFSYSFFPVSHQLEIKGHTAFMNLPHSEIYRQFLH